MRLRLRRGERSLLGVLVGVALFGAMPWSSAVAAFSGSTMMEIDGNTPVDSTGDWGSSADSYAALRDKITSAPNEVCNVVGAEADAVEPAVTIDEININSGPSVVASDVVLSNDLCGPSYHAWEVFENPALGDQVVLYLGWTRPLTTGEIDVLFPLLGPDSASQADDLIVSYDFNSFTQTTVVEVLDWTGDQWTPIEMPAGTFEGSTSDGVEELPSDAPLTFGEVAINLTGLGLFPPEFPCRSYTSSYVLSRSGNTSSSTLADFVDVASMTISNCETAPDLTVAKTHTGDLTQGQTGQYSITVSNSGSAQTSGTVSVVDTLPAGLSATSLNGTGWTCTLDTLTCIRSDALDNGSSYPPITLEVAVPTDAPSSVTNSAAVFGGGQTNTANDTATDPTTIVPPTVAYQIQGPFAPISRKSKVGTTIPLKIALAVDGTVISDSDAAGLLSPICRVFVSANSTPALPRTCMTYNADLNQFQYDWKVSKNTTPASIQIAFMAKNADGTTNITKTTEVTLTK